MVTVLSHAYPSTEATRMRNALIMQAPDVSVGRWTPENIPAGFLAEHAAAPKIIRSVAEQLKQSEPGSDLALARVLAGHLNVARREGGRIGSLEIETTYREIVRAGRGYCADIINAYTALALSAGLSVRSWAFSFDGFGGHGHIVAEIFDRQARRWVMLDVFNNVMPVAQLDGRPMSVEDFRKAFSANEATIDFVRIGNGGLGYSHDEKLREYYRLGIDQWYFWNGNNVVSRSSQDPLIRILANVSTPLAELTAMAHGTFPGIVPVPTPTNRAAIERMQLLRSILLFAATSAALLGISLVAEIMLLRSAARNRGEQPNSSGAAIVS